LTKCPYCRYEGEFKPLKTWIFRFYNVKMFKCPKCGGRFNHYFDVSPRGKGVEFVIRIGYRE
jgi:hypothetical protein